ncbi:hypothetical protein [Bacillus inaquosorum]|uniref:hypothetical protein n=1 Tax=Bacillus inaquosorum TaxID=483913 RepID=UPI003990098F
MYNCYYVPVLIPNPVPTQNTQISSNFSDKQNRREVRLNIDRGIANPIPPDETNDLGNGFYTFAWINKFQIKEGEFLTFSLEGTNIGVINGGFAPRDFAPLYAIESFPRKKNEWIMTLHNPTRSVRDLSVYLIAKT